MKCLDTRPRQHAENKLLLLSPTALLTAGALLLLQQQQHQRTELVTGTAAATTAEARHQVKTSGREPAAGITMIQHPNTAARARLMLQAVAPRCQMQSQMRLLHRSISTSAVPGHETTTPAAAGAAARASAQQWHMMRTWRMRMKLRAEAGGKYLVSSEGRGQGCSWTAGKRNSCCWQQLTAKRRCR